MDAGAVDRALALLAEQRVHALAGLLDLVAELGLGDRVQRVLDRIEPSGLSSLIASAVTARLRGDPDRIDEVVARAAEHISCLVLVAPRLDLARWRRVPLASLLPVMPLVPREIVLGAVQGASESGVDLAALIACAAPFLDATGLVIARQRAAEITEPTHREHHRVMEQVLVDPTPRILHFPEIAAMRWWITEPTKRCIDELRALAYALPLHPPRPGDPVDLISLGGDPRDLQDVIRGLCLDLSVGPVSTGERSREGSLFLDLGGTTSPLAEVHPSPGLTPPGDLLESQPADHHAGGPPATPAGPPGGPPEAGSGRFPGGLPEPPAARPAAAMPAARPAGAMPAGRAAGPMPAGRPPRPPDLPFGGPPAMPGGSFGGPPAMPGGPYGGLPAMPGPPPMPPQSPPGPPGLLRPEDRPEDLGEPTAPTREPRRQVAIGFAPEHAAATPIVDLCLVPDTDYWLWVEIAPDTVPGAVPGPRAPLPDMPAGAELDVVLFTGVDQLRIDEASRRGRFALDGSRATVVAGAAEPPSGQRLWPRRLFFPVRTPGRTGASTVRVNVYHRGTLLQSHVVTAQVEPVSRPGPGMLTRAIDYAITSRLAVARFAALPPPRLSILAHHEPETASHGFRFFADGAAGAPAFVAEASLDGAKLTPIIEFARRALRIAAWGKPEAFRSLDEHPYRYAAPTQAQLTADLVSLARHGCRLWSEALIAFGVYDRQRAQLRDLLQRPGAVQLALQDGPRHVFPAALVYDHPLDSNRSDLAVCRRFLDDLAAGAALDGTPCFAGACPHLGDKQIVCPSGFWGFRHEIGVAPHLRGREIATAIGRRPTAAWLLVAMVSTDPALTERAKHIAALTRLPELDTITVDDRTRCLAALEELAPHISYFYCHGGVTEAGTPYLEVGPRGSDMITSDNFTDLVVQDHAPRPLVVLNGCHTTATTPEQAFDLVSGFLCHANAAGVVGTEITVFEPLARAFGESLLAHFIGGATLRAAVRRARLDLLGMRNPLGLAYVPFALPELVLEGQN